MTKESLILLLLVAGAAVGIIYVIRQASTNEGDWDSYRKIRLGESYSSVRGKFSTASDDFVTMADARTAGHSSDFKQAVEVGATKMFIVPSRDDMFVFAFDKDGKLVYKNYRGSE